MCNSLPHQTPLALARLRRFGPTPLLALALWLSCASGPSVQAATERRLKVITKQEGDRTRFLVQNLDRTEITSTLEVGVVNLQCDKELPYTATYPPGTTTEAFTLTPVDPEQTWNYSFTNYFTTGSLEAVHDDDFLYALPFAPGSAFKVTQGYHGKYSHTGPDEYAVDFRMDCGTPVHAARGGVVVRVKADSDKGGSSRKFENDANYIIIRHKDGTLANYAHLEKDGCFVRVGQRVRTGQLIGLSGNTGFSTGPHLHFSVFKAKDGRERMTLPVKFQTADAAGITLVEGRSYRTPDLEETPNRVPASIAVINPAEGMKTLRRWPAPSNHRRGRPQNR